MKVPCIARILECESGAAAVEFAILAPIFLVLIVGILSGGLLMATASSLHYAAEKAARCFSVAAGQCPDSSKTEAYALSVYSGASSPTPSFTASTAACGHQVVGSVTFTLGGGIAQWSIPLGAKACFP